jgi:hypothetical protein
LKRIAYQLLYVSYTNRCMVFRYGKETSFTKLKGHRLHFLKTKFLSKNRNYALERNDNYGTKKLNLSVNGELENTLSQNYAETLKSLVLLLIN